MAGFSSYDNLISVITTSGQYVDYNFSKVAPSASQAAPLSFQTLWTAAGNPGAGAAPTAQTTYTSNTNCIYFNNTSPQNKYLLTFGAVSNLTCTIMLYDRLCTSSGLLTYGTGFRPAVTPTLTRYTSGIGVEAWVELSQATNTTAPIVTMLYTDSGGSSQTGNSLTFPAAASVITDMIKLPFATGAAPGIVQCSGINVNTASSSTGTMNVVLIHPLAYLPLTAGVWNERDMVLQLAALPQIYDGASLQVAILNSAAQTTTVWGQIRVAYN